MFIRVSLDKEEYTEKPTGILVGQISKRIAQQVFNGELKDFADLISNKGCTWCPAIFKINQTSQIAERKNSLFQQAQLLALDFDSGLDIDQIISRSKENSLVPNLIHESFSSTEELKKYRVIFVLPEPDTQQKIFVGRIRKLLEIFPEADKATKDPARLFFGSNKGIAHIDSSSINIISPLEYKHNPIEESYGLVTRIAQEPFKWGDRESSISLLKQYSFVHRRFIMQQLYIASLRVEGLRWENKNETGYEVIKDETIRLAGIAGITPWLIHYYFFQAATKNNRFFSRWQYSLKEVITANFLWKSDRPDILAKGKFQITKKSKK